MLLIGGDKTGNPNWYKEFVPKAVRIYAQHLKDLGEQNLIRNGCIPWRSTKWPETSMNFAQR
jgi:hypothetical protein